MNLVLDSGVGSHGTQSLPYSSCVLPQISPASLRPAVPTLLVLGTGFVEDSLSMEWGGGAGAGGMVQAVMRVMGSHSPPTVQPGS